MEKKKEWAIVVLSVIQFIFCIAALSRPQYIIGNLLKYEAQNWEEGIDKQKEDVNNTVRVPSHLGIFFSIINGTFDGSNREGLKGVFGFALVSTIASFFTMLWSIQVVCHCCKSCGNAQKYEDGCKYVSDKLRNLAKTNFSAGVSDWAVSAMIAFSAKDLSGEQFGASFYLSVLGGFVAFVQHCVQKSSSGYSQVSQPVAPTDAGIDTSDNRQAEIAQSPA